MQCQKCSNWKCESMSYAELEENWELAIGGIVTPGHRRRFKKETVNRGLAFEDVRLSYKYCSKGILTRFYIMKSDKDTKGTVPIKNCREYRIGSEADVSVEVPSPLWTACTIESHGPSRVKGISFTPGLYERGIYFRVPMCGEIKPKVSKQKMTVTLSFDSNEEYLRWWGRLYPEEFRKLNAS